MTYRLRAPVVAVQGESAFVAPGSVCGRTLSLLAGGYVCGGRIAQGFIDETIDPLER